jgi:hypothetical protein
LREARGTGQARGRCKQGMWIKVTRVVAVRALGPRCDWRPRRNGAPRQQSGCRPLPKGRPSTALTCVSNGNGGPGRAGKPNDFVWLPWLPLWCALLWPRSALKTNRHLLVSRLSQPPASPVACAVRCAYPCSEAYHESLGPCQEHRQLQRALDAKTIVANQRMREVAQCRTPIVGAMSPRAYDLCRVVSPRLRPTGLTACWGCVVAA